MPTVTVLPHPELCPQGARFEASAGSHLCDALAAHGVAIDHACAKACVCTTCHVIVRQGFASLRAASDDEEDQLGKAWGLEAHSRLRGRGGRAGPAATGASPRYTLNAAGDAT